MGPKSPKVAVLVLALAFVAAACGGGGGASGGGKESEEGGTITIGSDTANDHGTKRVSGGSLEVEQDDFYFEPTIIDGKAGQTVKLELKNEGKNLHNFSIASQGIDQDVNPDGSATVTVTFPKSGVLEFFCKFHRAQGMAGELKVT
jgi:plastocyanin